jgi:hypothetical protein
VKVADKSPEISKKSKVVIAKDVLSCDLSGEAAMLDLKSGRYYGLNPVGARIWNLLKEPRTVESLIQAVLAEYDVPREECERDALDILGRLASEGLIEVSDAEMA